ncbi:MAG: hypothetical protein KGL95_04975 [Patescibacteria group bacterium]|nr:hypothetical protein [Patescibacteria group bacterium]
MNSKLFIAEVEVDTLILLFIFMLIGIGIAVWQNYHPHFHSITPLPEVKKILPLSVEPIDNGETFVWISPDGQQELEMQTNYFRDTSKEYTFSDKDMTANNTHRIFSQVVDNQTIIKIPYNSWSPDNAYIFVDRVRGGKTEYLVAKASGEPFAKDMQTLNVSSLFVNQQTGFTLHEVTGWASPTLLIITTTSGNADAGTSYWFDVPSQSFIPLATQF